jgi:hypothetical protein
MGATTIGQHPSNRQHFRHVAKPSTRVYATAAMCMVVGLAIGYFFLGNRPIDARTDEAIADVKASNLIEKSKNESKNARVPIQIVGIYQASHQFKESAGDLIRR